MSRTLILSQKITRLRLRLFYLVTTNNGQILNFFLYNYVFGKKNQKHNLFLMISTNYNPSLLNYLIEILKQI
jgi:hypothetical protein